ncbi:MAG: amino acid ABC transporter permease [Betaproteobacteria bacterium]
MATTLFPRHAARPAPPVSGGALTWLRTNLFAGWSSGLTTVVLVLLAVYGFSAFFDWAVFRAVFRPDADACRAAGAGACWGMIAEKIRPLLFGRYPFEAQWRPALAILLMLSLLVATCRRPQRPRRWFVVWTAALATIFILMAGGVFGLGPVPTARWGGLPLTLMLAIGGIAAAFPLGVLLALGRRSTLPAVHTLCAVYIEALRGIPLVSVLFLASFLFPLFLPPGTSVDVLLRVFAGLTLFAAAYLAEVVRGGLQSILRGQIEAAAALGLGYWQIQRRIVLPQAFAAVLPALMNNFIGTLKDTSLVTVVGLYELTGALAMALSGSPDWRPFYLEGYLFIGAIYWCLCFSLSRYSRRLEASHPGKAK